MSASVELIVGLGNPGPEYEQTRHNAGFWFVEALAAAAGAGFRPEAKFLGELCRLASADKQVWVLKPGTYMNRSGQAVAKLANFYKIPVHNILVVHDDLDLAPGVARLKQGGGHGGHNGLRDISAQLGTDFLRLRLGIGHPGDSRQVVNYVLSKPSQADRQAIEGAIADGMSVLPAVLGGELQRAMNMLHRKKD